MPADTNVKTFRRGERALHIFALSSFAILQPLLEAFSRQTVYLHDLRLSWSELTCLLTVLGLGLPLVLYLVDRGVLAVTRRFGGYGQNLVIVGLGWICLLGWVRLLCNVSWFVHSHSVWLVTVLVAGLLGMALAVVYRRSREFQRLLAVAAISTVIFPLYFLARMSDFEHQQSVTAPATLGRPTPVVLVICDEFSGVTLMRQDQSLNAEWFPNFARLASTANWYRHATSVHARTEFAVPAILTGCNPSDQRQVVSANHPSNLFSLLLHSGQMGMTVFEPYTRLCPELTSTTKTKLVFQKRMSALFATLTRVYPRLILPADLPWEFPAIPAAWYGVSTARQAPEDEVGLIRYPLNTQRAEQLEHFLRTLPRTVEPQFSFLHIALPHYPWCFSASGGLMSPEQTLTGHSVGTTGELGEDWDPAPEIVLRHEWRYRHQVRYVDQFLGRLMDRLREQGVWDSCLLILVADHGVSFQPGHSRRVPDEQNLPDLMTVPLFIKFPGQTTGQISDENVETIDVLPTIADVLQSTPRPMTDGSSLLSDQRRPRKTFHMDQGLTILEATYPQLQPALDRQALKWDHARHDTMPRVISARPDWHGRRVSDFTVTDHILTKYDLSLSLNWSIAGQHTVAISHLPPITSEDFGSRKVEWTWPQWLEGACSRWEIEARTPQFLVAVDGVIVDSATGANMDLASIGFSLQLPESISRQHAPRVELFVVSAEAGDHAVLTRLFRHESAQDLRITSP